MKLMQRVGFLCKEIFLDKVLWILMGFIIVSGTQVLAEEAGLHDANVFNLTMFEIAILLLLAKISGLLEKLGQPAVLGELGIGIILGNLHYFGINWFESIKNSEIIEFLAEMGVVILLFQAGLESNIKRILSTGKNALLVAILGASLPFALGVFVAGPLFFPSVDFKTHLFLGAALTASSMGIGATLFRQYKKMSSIEARTVLGATVIDDILGMIFIPVVSAIITHGQADPATFAIIVGQAVLFLLGSVVIGQMVAPYLGKFFSKIQTGTGMKFTLAFSIGLIFAYFASLIGLAPIIGAFAAGLFLDPIHFDNFEKPRISGELSEIIETEKFTPKQKERLEELAHDHAHTHVENLFEPLAHFMIPLFFITIGMKVDLEIFTNVTNLMIAIGIVVIIVTGRLIATLFAGKGVNKLIVACSMIAGGEVGFVFASIGKDLGVLNDQIFGILIAVTTLTTLVGPFGLNKFLKEQQIREREAAKA